MKDDNSNNNGFDEWYQDLKNQTPEKQSQILLDKMKEHLSKEDSECMDEIIKLLKNNPDKNTDILFLEDNLKEKFPDINPLAILNYYFLLTSAGFIELDHKKFE